MNDKKIRAFSLTELLIVLAIIAILFAASAPIVTNRAKSDIASKDSVWNFVYSDPERNAFFDPGEDNWKSSLIIGNLPNIVEGKVAIRADGTLNHLAFNFSPDLDSSDIGVNLADFYANNTNKRFNMYFGTDLSKLGFTQSYNTVMGIGALERYAGSEENFNSTAYTVFGNDAMKYSQIVTPRRASSYADPKPIAIGTNAAKGVLTYPCFLDNTSRGNHELNISIGSGANSYVIFNNAGNPVLKRQIANIAIGYNSMSKDTYTAANADHIRFGNTFIGAETGNGFSFTDQSLYYGMDDSHKSSRNIVIGSRFVGSDYSENNILIGVGAHETTQNRLKDLVAVGNKACDAIPSDVAGNKIRNNVTCIGYNSAGQIAGNQTELKKLFTDARSPNSKTYDTKHAFFGGTPLGGFSGYSVLELHLGQGMYYNGSYNDNNKYNNVVMNSNLIVRGNFHTSGYKTKRTTTSDTGIKQCVDQNNAVANILGYSGYYCTEMSNKSPKSANAIARDEVSAGGYETTGLSVYSDRNLKTDIVKNNDGLEKILSLVPYHYTFKNDKTKTPHVGVIAQDLQKVFPTSVSKTKDGFLQIRWDEMFFAMINAIKTLGTKIETAANELYNLEQELKSLRVSNKASNKKISALDKRLTNLEKKSRSNK